MFIFSGPKDVRSDIFLVRLNSGLYVLSVGEHEGVSQILVRPEIVPTLTRQEIPTKFYFFSCCSSGSKLELWRGTHFEQGRKQK